MKRINDGRYIQRYPEIVEIESCEYIYGWDSEKCEAISKAVEDYTAEPEFLKTYYMRKEKVFTGVIVGMKLLVVNAFLFAETYYDFRGHEHVRICKQTNEQIKCALVYYGCNKSRYVPLDDIKFVERSST